MTDDAPLSPLDEELRALVDRTRGIPTAPAASKARVLARVEGLVGPPPGGGGDGGGAQASQTATGSPPGSLLRRVLPMAASFAIGTGLGAFAMHEHEGGRREPVAVLPGPTIAPPESAPPSPAPSPATAIVSAREIAAHVRTEKTHTTPAPSAVPVDQLTAERSILDVARSALEREDPQTALLATARHERRYPSGILVQEREAMAIRALVALGRVEEARGRVDLFRRRFSDSLLLPTLEDAVREGGAAARQ